MLRPFAICIGNYITVLKFVGKRDVLGTAEQTNDKLNFVAAIANT